MMPLGYRDRFYYQWQLPVLVSILHYRNPVKITDENAKEAQVQKSVKYWKLGFYY
jgi:hypothetical protein